MRSNLDEFITHIYFLDHAVAVKLHPQELWPARLIAKKVQLQILVVNVNLAKN